MTQEDVGNSSKSELKEMWLKLGKEWIVFLSVMFSPWVVLLFIVTGVLIWVKLAMPVGTNLPPMVDTTITLVMALASGVLGALISERWSKVNEKSILITRGKSAIRGLGLLLRNIAGIEQRVIRYTGGLDKEEDDPLNEDVLRLSYEEIKVRCIELQEETINAIEEWQDIIPEAAQWKTQIGVISDLKNDRLVLVSEISRLQVTLEDHGKKSSIDQEQLEKLKSDLQQKEKELSSVNAKLKKSESKLSNSVVGGLIFQQNTDPKSLLRTGNADSVVGTLKTCTRCGNSSFSQGITLGLYDDGICESCRRNSTSLPLISSGKK